MVGASKILTVSYGTFSCTLEGFDEPFSTMKAIAEYFRDLAADDRYFGATPPTPDAEMLHRIAEREIQRRVEAKISEHGIVLRPEGSDAAGLAVSHVPAREGAAPVGPVAEVQAAKPSIPESVAQKLMRIRAVVSAANKPEEPASEAPFEEDEPASDFAAAATAPASDFGFDLDLGEMPRLKAQADETAEAEPAPRAVDDAGEVEHTTDTVARTMADPESDFAAREDDEVIYDDEPEAIAEALEDEEPVLADAGEAIPEIAGPQDDEAGIVAFDTPEEVEADATAKDAVESDFETLADAPDAEEMIEEPHIADIAAADAAAPLVAVDEDWAEAVEDEAWAEVAEDIVAAEVEEEPADVAEAAPFDLSAFRAAEVDEDEDSVAEAMDDEDEDSEADIDVPSARVIRISRAEDDEYAIDEDEFDEDEIDEDDLAAAFDMPEDDGIEDRTAAVMAALSESDYDEDFEETAGTGEGDDDAILAQIGAAIGETGLPEADEEELLRELADAAREMPRDGHEGRAILENASEDDEASVERLMEEAKSKLEGVETRRRFSAIAHLKAAVAATVADRKMKSGDAGVVAMARAPQDDTERYRDDLSKAVRPRRPSADSMPTTQRPTIAKRMAPLVLVSEQRVDRAEDDLRPDTGAVVRPRRIRAAVADDIDYDDIDEDLDVAINPEEARSFAEFAERLGATSLPELLEAAAAYTSSVEGNTHFSRPQIIKKVAHMAEEEDYSREDSLRSFGMLLRQGKIQKVRRGQFVLTDASRFMDEARRAAN